MAEAVPGQTATMKSTDSNGHSRMDESSSKRQNESSSKKTSLKTPTKEPKTVSEPKSDASSGSDYDDMLTCMVCDRAFTTERQLIHHQTQKKHFLCSFCDSRFDDVHQLKDHKDKESHWSDVDDEDDRKGPSSSDDGGDDPTSQNFSEVERLF